MTQLIVTSNDMYNKVLLVKEGQIVSTWDLDREIYRDIVSAYHEPSELEDWDEDGTLDDLKIEEYGEMVLQINDDGTKEGELEELDEICHCC